MLNNRCIYFDNNGKKLSNVKSLAFVAPISLCSEKEVIQANMQLRQKNELDFASM